MLGKEELGTRQFDFAQGKEIREELSKAFLTKTQQQWLDLIGDKEFCVTPVCSLEEALASELAGESGMLAEREEDLGKVQYLQPAIRLSATPGSIDRRAPRLGEHREEILSALGYAAEEIDRLKKEHII